MGKPITVDQLLNLADRAEYGGGLSQAEADRLREGINALQAHRTLLSSKLGQKARRLVRVEPELRSIRGLVIRTRHRGDTHVALWQLEALIDDDVDLEAA